MSKVFTRLNTLQKNYFSKTSRRRYLFSVSSILRKEYLLVWAIIFLSALIMLVNFAYLTKYPMVFIDESWYANTAWNWLKTGVNFDSMHAVTFNQFGVKTTAWPVIGNLFYLISFKFLGLGLFQARLVSWIFGVFLLLTTYFVGRFLYGKITGTLAVLILSLSPPFLQASHYARPDIILATIAMLAFGIVLIGLEGNKWWAHTLAGLLISVSLDIHQNAILFFFAFAILYISYYRTKLLNNQGTWFFLVGAGAGIMYFIYINVLPNLSTYKLSLLNTHVVPLISLNPLTLLRSVRDEIGRYHFYENGLDFVLIGLSTVYLLVRRLKSDQNILLLAGSVFAGLVLLIGNKNDVYAILLYPFFMIMVAETLLSLISDSEGFANQRVITFSLLFFYIINGAFHFARPLMDSQDYNYYAITDEIKSVIPQNDRVMGLPNWWLGLADYDYQSTLNLTYFHILGGYNLEESLSIIRPDYIIVDNGLRDFLVTQGAYKTGAGFEIYRLPSQEFYDFLALRGEKILEFSDHYQGEFQIYAIHWDKAFNQ